MWTSSNAYAALRALQEDENRMLELDGVQRRVVDSTLWNMDLSGVGLDDARKARYEEVDVDISRLANKWNQNLMDDTRAFYLVVGGWVGGWVGEACMIIQREREREMPMDACPHSF